MKPILKSFLTVFVLIALGPLCHAQYAYRLVPRTADPANCDPNNGEVYYNTTSNAVRQCVATDTWGPVGLSGLDLTIAQGTITADTPVINTTVTWNNAAVAFTEWFLNVTDTASDAASLLADMQVGGTSQFSVGKSGDVLVAAGGTYGFTGRSILSSSADGVLAVANNAGTGFTRLTLGPSSIAGLGMTVDVVGGQVQGVILANGDGSTVSFAELAAATDGSIIYCDDCTKATPCAGGGTGALAKRYNGAWDCD